MAVVLWNKEASSAPMGLMATRNWAFSKIIMVCHLKKGLDLAF
jgi:hypothetical protein